MSNLEIEYSENMLLKKPHSVIQFDKTTGELKRPTLLLRKKNGEYIGKLDYTNLKMSLVGKGLDEISFDVHKYVDGRKCPFWEQLTDLKTVEYVGYGRFELSVQITDAEEIVKSCVAISLECELGQLIIREGHYNDDEDIVNDSSEGADDIPDANKNVDNTGDDNNTSPPSTVLYNKKDPQHSLLHRVLSKKAPHWSIGYVSPLLNVDGYVYESNQFQRTYTADGISIYDFLTGEVAAESNCIFLFDTFQRIIHCVNIESCVYDTATMNVIEGAYKKDDKYYDKNGSALKIDTPAYCEGIGEDTNILVSKQKLAKDFGVEFNKDSVKNCFYVTGGDDTINDWVAAANLSGNNYIYEFSNFMYDDMSHELRNALIKYNEDLDSKREEFYGPSGVYVLDSDNTYSYQDGVCRDTHLNIITDFIYDDDSGKLFIKNPYAYKDEDGIVRDENDDVLPAEKYRYECRGLYTTYCDLITRRSYLNDGKFPDISTRPTTALTEYENLKDAFSTGGIVVVVTQTISENDYAIALKNAKAYIETILDSRYTITIKESSLENGQSADTYVLNTDVCITRVANEKDSLGSETPAPLPINIEKIKISDAKENKNYIKQKLEFKKASLDISALDIVSHSPEELENFFSDYNLTSLQAYASNFHSCMDLLIDLSNGNIHAEGENANSTYDELYDKYEEYCMAAETILDKRQNQVNELDQQIISLNNEIAEFRDEISLKKVLSDEQWKEFCSYVREDEYNNGNYISDGLSDSELIEKANTLLAAATKELQKSCVLQRSISVNLMNLFAIPEYQSLFNDFEIFNYIRVNVDDEIYKVRIVQLDFDENTPESIQVTFSEDVEYQDGTVSDLQDMRSQIAGISTSYNSTYRQANQGAIAQNTILKMKEEGLLSSEFLIKNSNSEEIIIDSTGILSRSLDDIDCYSDFQCKIIGKGLYLTSDNWKSVNAGIGLMKFNDEWQYGVIADTIVGNLLEGNQVVIDNDAVTIDKDGMTLRGGTIDWETPIAQENIVGLTNFIATQTDFKEKVTNQLSTLGDCIPFTQIGQDYVISPKIGGGYLCITNTAANGDKYFIEIDPNHESGYANSNYLFHVHKEYIDDSGKKIDNTIMGINNDGNGFFDGEIRSDCISSGSFSNITSSDGMALLREGLLFSSSKGKGTGRIPVNGYTNDLCYVGCVRLDIPQTIGGRWEGVVITPENILFARTTDSELPNSNNIQATNSTSIAANAIQTETLYSESQVNTSDKRLKTNIQPIQKPIEFIQSLQPCEFHMISGKSGRKHFGFLAQDVEEALSATTGDAGVLVKYPPVNEVSKEPDETIDFSDDTTYTYGLRYDEFIAPMVATIQDLYKQIDTLKEEIKALKEQ